MQSSFDFLMVSIILMNFALLVSSRIFTCIRFVAFQGVITGILPLLGTSLDWQTILISGVTIILKGIVFPAFLFYALKKVAIRREVEPFIGYTFSVIAGIAMLLSALWLGARLSGETVLLSNWVLKVSLFTIFVGLFGIITRRKAISQVLHFIVMENGIYLFGFAFLLEQPLIIELGILLDVFVAVFVMGITIFHISKEFNHIDTNELRELKD